MGDSTDAPTSLSVTVAGGVVTMVNGSPATAPVDITLQKANLTGTVYESDGATPAANTQRLGRELRELLPEHKHRVRAAPTGFARRQRDLERHRQPADGRQHRRSDVA